MKRTLIVLAPLLACSLFAQGPAIPRSSPASAVSMQLDRVEPMLRDRAVAVRRDAFLVSQVVAAIGDLEDFQHSAALQKARDRVDTALRRARENPPAAPQTITALSQTLDAIHRAQQQGSTADVAGLKREMLRQTHLIQQILFKELDDSRADRQALTDVQARLARLSTDLDQAVGEALGSTFEYFRAGGQ